MKKKLDFSNYNFDRLTKEYITAINEMWFSRLVNLEDCKSTAGMLILIQNELKEKLNCLENGTDYIILDKVVYKCYEKLFDGLFDIVDFPDCTFGKEMLEYLISLLDEHIMFAIASGIKDGSISKSDLGD